MQSCTRRQFKIIVQCESKLSPSNDEAQLMVTAEQLMVRVRNRVFKLMEQIKERIEKDLAIAVTKLMVTM